MRKYSQRVAVHALRLMTDLLKMTERLMNKQNYWGSHHITYQLCLLRIVSATTIARHKIRLSTNASNQCRQVQTSARATGELRLFASARDDWGVRESREPTTLRFATPYGFWLCVCLWLVCGAGVVLTCRRLDFVSMYLRQKAECKQFHASVFSVGAQRGHAKMQKPPPSHARRIPLMDMRYAVYMRCNFMWRDLLESFFRN